MVLSCATAALLAANASAVPSNNAETLFFICISVDRLKTSSDAEIGVKLIHIGLQIRIRETVDYLAVLDDIVPVRDSRREPEVLFDQQDRKSFFLETCDRMADLLDDDRSKPF